MTGKRIASLDLLRGLAAFAVAIPHFFMTISPGNKVAEAVASLGVEIFFVLSGYVLAPQILRIVDSANVRGFVVFWVRRWMRTIPPYLIALIMFSIAAHKLWSADFVRYAFYVQNLTHQTNLNDYFSIAWSLSVEEWFYLVFPLFFLLLRCLFGLNAFASAIGFIVLIMIMRTGLGDMTHWGDDVRRVVVFRMDAIAWGVVLSLVVGSGLSVRPALAALGTLVLAIVAITATLGIANTESIMLKEAFPFYASAFGAAAIVMAVSLSGTVNSRPWLVSLSSWFGRISYSVYLFHLLVLSAVSGLPIVASFLAFLSGTIAVAWLMHVAVEAPILAARPRYGSAEPSTEKRELATI